MHWLEEFEDVVNKVKKSWLQEQKKEILVGIQGDWNVCQLSFLVTLLLNCLMSARIREGGRGKNTTLNFIKYISLFHQRLFVTQKLLFSVASQGDQDGTRTYPYPSQGGLLEIPYRRGAHKRKKNNIRKREEWIKTGISGENRGRDKHQMPPL